MLKVGILSDTHGYLNPQLDQFFAECDEIWHAGDWGDLDPEGGIFNGKKVRGVFGNIDGRLIRNLFAETALFKVEELKVCILHIGGYPGRYAPLTKKIIADNPPDLLICGHSHILKVMRDPKNKFMFFNPGAAGNSGFHQKCTALRLKISGKRLFDLEVWEHTRFEV